MNPKSGLGQSLGQIVRDVESSWGGERVDVSYQISRSVEDGQRKAEQAVRQGADTVLVVGGDGMVNSIGSALLGTGVALGVIPAGSGNGFARHFGIPLVIGRAIKVLAGAEHVDIDAGFANDKPFFVTCSMAADATLVKHFEKSPIRGVLPYALAAAYGFFEYTPQPFRVAVDGKEHLTFKDPIVFTVANLTQFGGGARIAPNACPDDGRLELVVIARSDLASTLPALPRLFNGTLEGVPGIVTRRFQRMETRRKFPGPIQLDGELVEAPAMVTVRVRRKVLTVLVPRRSAAGRA
jgi:diacylglycerol kinase family enzyme